MSEANIVLKLKDQASSGFNRMADANKGFNKSLEETRRQAQQYNQRLDSLIREQSKLQTSLEAAKNELNSAKKTFKETGSAANSDELTDANEKYDKIKTQLTNVTKAAKDTQRSLYDLNKSEKKASKAAPTLGNGSSYSEDDGSAGGLLAQLGQAGATAMVGQVLSQAVGTYYNSALGSTKGNYISSALSSGSMGAAIGTAIAPGIGTAIGAAIGAGFGLVTAKMDEFEKQDESFKSYVQDSTENALQEQTDAITAGSAVAGQREQDALAFNQLLGGNNGTKYLSDLRTMAAATPMEYSDLTTMSRSLAAGFSGAPSRMLSLMTSIGNAGSALGIDASGMNEMAQAMSRMQSSGKTTLEYLNIFQDRGVNVVGMLSKGLGKTQGEIYDMISKGEIKGTDAVNIIQKSLDKLYAGAMEKQSQTFAGLTSTLEDAQTEMNNAFGEGYNKTRKQGIQDEIDYLSGDSSEKVKKANEAIGAWNASLENDKEKYIRMEQDAVLNSREYQSLMLDGSDESYAKAGAMLMEAKVKGMSDYNASDGAQLALQSELTLAENIKNDSAAKDEYWNAGYLMGEQYNLGLASTISSFKMPTVTVKGKTYDEYAQIGDPLAVDDSAKRHAYGLSRVPFNGYPAVLHQGERVLTAAQARQQDAGGGSGRIVFSGNYFTVRKESDIDSIASALLDKLMAAGMGYAGAS